MGVPRITCPYCFEEFSDEEVLFRANTGYTQNEIEQLQGSGMQAEALAELQLFRRFDDENARSNDKKLDQELIRFWKDRGQANGYINADPKWDYPHIDPKQQAQFQQMVVICPQTSEDGFLRDPEGFVTRVVDKRSDPTVQMTRLCPHCHNPLPLPDYGKYPVLFISVVGVTSSGKTVYLNQLLTQFATTMHNSGYRIGTSNLSTIDEAVMPGRPLPSSTDDRIMRRPLAVTMTKMSSPQEGLTIVFYDIAGENCVSGVDANGRPRGNSTVAHFIAHCDGLLFLIDPEQVPLFAPVSNAMPSELPNVINAVKLIRTAANQAQPDWNHIPVAAVLTKSDLLRDFVPSDNPIFTHINRTNPEDGQDRRGFMREEFFKIHSFLHRQFQLNARAISDNMTAFAETAYFAVSAITCGVESRFEKYKNSYSLDRENEQAFMRLKTWGREWNARTTEERAHFRSCPVAQLDGSPISLPLEESITKATGGGLTEIWAVDVQDDSTEKLYLSLWDVVAEIDLVGFPTGSPNPRRIEEPIQWILWKKELLEPYFTPELPTKPLLCSARKWELLQLECEERNIQRKKAFYEGEDL